MADKLQTIDFEEISRIRQNYKKDSENHYDAAYFLTRIRLLKEAWEKCKIEHTVVYHTKVNDPKEFKEYMAKYEQSNKSFLELFDYFENLFVDFLLIETATAQPVAPTRTTKFSTNTVGASKIFHILRKLCKVFMTMVHNNPQFSEAQRM